MKLFFKQKQLIYSTKYRFLVILLYNTMSYTVTKAPSEIKIGDSITFSGVGTAKVIAIKKGKRHSREDGYPYEFTGLDMNDNKCYETHFDGYLSYGVQKHISNAFVPTRLNKELTAESLTDYEIDVLTCESLNESKE